MRYLVLGVFLLSFIVVALQSTVATSDNNLIIVSEKGRTINGKVGDVLQLAPFKYSVTEKFNGCRVKVKLTGGMVLDYIGESILPIDKEGKGCKTAFFYFKCTGKTTITLSLVDVEEKPLCDDCVYEVEAKE